MNQPDHGHKRCAMLVTAVLLSVSAGCSALSRQQSLHAHGVVAGQFVNGRVDSPLAEYSIERSRVGHSLNPEFDEQLRQIDNRVGPNVPDGETLRWITKRYSRDVATVVLAERLAADPTSAPFTAIYSDQLAMMSAGQIHPDAPSPLKGNVIFLFVPGWYWNDRSYDGDLEVPRYYLDYYGYRTELLATDTSATVEQNAIMVAERLRELQCAGKWVVLVSASKGSAETAFALGHLLAWEDSSHVLAWVNVNGAVRGSPLADEMLNWRRNLTTRLLLLRTYRDRAAGLRSMRTKRRRRVFESLSLPPHIVIINVVAVPLSGQVTRRAGGYDKLLNKYGPHDGSLLIRDEIIDNAPTVIELGFDHFFFDPMIGPKTIALVNALEQWLNSVSVEPLAPPEHLPPAGMGREFR